MNSAKRVRHRTKPSPPPVIPAKAGISHPYTLVDSDAALAQAAAALSDVPGRLAVDCERSNAFTYSDQNRLVQIADADLNIYLIDMMGIDNLEPLRAIFKDREIILHSANNDMSSLYQDGLKPNRVVDTEPLAKLLGYPRVALSALALEVCEFQMSKKFQRANWATRPIPPAWLEYAVGDVLYLERIYQRLMAQLCVGWRHPDANADGLEPEQRASDAQKRYQGMMAAYNLGTYAPPTPSSEPWKKLPAWKHLKGRQLDETKQLYIWADLEARRRDRDINDIVPKKLMIEIVQKKPRNSNEMFQIFRGHGRMVNKRIAESTYDTYQRAIKKLLDGQVLDYKIYIPNTHNVK